MKATVHKESIVKRLSELIKVISDKPVIPITESFLMEIKSSRLYMRATDLEVDISSSIEIKSDKDFSFCIPAKTFFGTIKLLSQEEFDMELKGTQVLVSAGKSKYKIPVSDAKEFPKTMKSVTEEGVTVLANSIKEAFKVSNEFTLSDDTRPALKGVSIRQEEEKIVIVATDAQILSYINMDVDSGKTRDMIVSKAFASLVAGISFSLGKAKLSMHDKNIKIDTEEYLISSTLVDAKYPNVKMIMPEKEEKRSVKLDTKEVTKLLKRLLNFVNKNSNTVKFSLKDGSMTVTAEDIDYSKEGLEVISVEKHHDIEFGLNLKYLLTIMSKIDTETFSLYYMDYKTAFFITPVYIENKVLRNDFIIMPIMLNK